jgi:hypothetical protein
MDPLAGLFEDTWRIYRRHAGHLIGVAFAIYLPAAIIAGLLALAAGGFGKALGGVVQTCAAFLLEAALVKAVQQARDGGTQLSAARTIRAVLPDLVPVAVASLVAGIAIWIGLLIVVVPGLYLLTIWAVVMPVIVIERSGPFAAFGRSHQLVRGHGWQVFGTLVLLFLILIVLGLALGNFFVALPDAVRGGLGNIILGTLVAPYIAVAVTLMYYRLAAAAASAP